MRERERERERERDVNYWQDEIANNLYVHTLIIY